MKPKTIVTIVILAFVAVSVGYLIVKEVRAARTPDVAAEPYEAAPAATGEGEKGVASGDEAVDEGLTTSTAGRKVVVTYYYNTSRR